MYWRNRVGIYGAYLCGTAGIGFTLPFLPIYLGERGLSDHSIGWISTCAALSALAQFPLGLWSDRIGRRKPFLLVALGLLACSAALLNDAESLLWMGFLIVLFAENGICRTLLDSLTGAEVTELAGPQETASALGRLRLWKPLGIIAVALFGSWWTSRFGIAAMLVPVTFIQCLGFVAALLIVEKRDSSRPRSFPRKDNPPPTAAVARRLDPMLWAFIAAMVLFHAANAPAGLYLGLFLKREMTVSDSLLAYAFVVSMIGWMLVVWPAGQMADRFGRRPLLMLAWAIMSIRLLFISLATVPWQIVVNQLLDGVANGLFSVLAAAWVTDRLADPRRNGEAQAIVGTSLVIGSAIGAALSARVVGHIGYRPLFAVLAAIGAVATAFVVLFIPETLRTASLPRAVTRPEAMDPVDLDLTTSF